MAARLNRYASLGFSKKVQFPMLSPSESDLMTVAITSRCSRQCAHCWSQSPHLTKHQDMSPQSFVTAVSSLQGWLKPGRMITIGGGEPTDHEKFEVIALCLGSMLSLPTSLQGRSPISDLRDMALRRLCDRDGACGLSTSLGDGFYRHYETILDTFPHLNIETHGCGKRHHAVLIDRADYCAVTGISDRQWELNRDHCPHQSAYGPYITDHGAYFCGAAAAIDQLYYQGRHAWPVEVGWWNRRPDQFGDQLSLCDHCALAQPTPSLPDSSDRDIVGRTAWTRLKALGSPRSLELMSELHLPSSSMCMDNPMDASAQPRVEIGHHSILPRRLSCVLVSVGFGDQLARTLPLNMPHFDQVVVVTTPEDQHSRAIAEQCGATIVLSRRCYDDDHAFNKGRMLNDGLAALVDPDWVVLTDADIFMHDGLRAFVMGNALNPGCLYYTSRLDEHSVDHQSLSVNQEPNGYFQLFQRRAKAIRRNWPSVISESFCSAGSVDTHFFQQWGPAKAISLPRLPTRHLASDRLAQHWNGTASPTPCWRQLGVMNADGLTTFELTHTLPERLMLTDSLSGKSHQIPRAQLDDKVFMTTEGIVFFGDNIGQNHIHVAFWDDGTWHPDGSMPTDPAP